MTIKYNSNVGGWRINGTNVIMSSKEIVDAKEKSRILEILKTKFQEYKNAKEKELENEVVKILYEARKEMKKESKGKLNTSEFLASRENDVVEKMNLIIKKYEKQIEAQKKYISHLEKINLKLQTENNAMHKELLEIKKKIKDGELNVIRKIDPVINNSMKIGRKVNKRNE